jgi:monoamine oxidase
LSATIAVDAVVIGGGLAGLTAARDLADRGKKVTLLEAHDRLGGRVHPGEFLDTGAAVEFGGTYISRSNRNIAREIDRYGLEFEAAPLVETYNHLLGGRSIESSIPIAPEEILSFERAAKYVLDAVARLAPAERLEKADYAGLDISWRQFIDGVDLEPATRDLFDGWVQTEAGRHLEELTALSPLWTTVRLDSSIANWQLVLDSKVGGGTGALIDAMVRGSDFEVRTSAAVEKVAQDGGKVQVTTIDGERFEADVAVVAVPVNAWETIAFEPGLGDGKRAGASLRPGSYGVKGWALVRDAPPAPGGQGSLGGGHSVGLYVGDGSVGEDQLIGFFSAPTELEGGGVLDVNDRVAVQRELERFMPGCEVLAVAGDDLREDPYFRGSWASYVPGQVEFLEAMRSSEGRLVFAGADIARGTIMWMDGAVESGGDAAVEAERILEQGPVSPASGAPARPTPAVDARELIEGEVACFNAGDLDGVSRYFAEDCRLIDLNRQVTYSGRRGIVYYCESLLADCDRGIAEVVSVTADDGRLAAEMSLRITKGGLETTTPYVVVSRLVDGLIKEEKVYCGLESPVVDEARNEDSEMGKR